MKQLEKRFYSREELAQVLNVSADSSHFARDVKNKLINWGYSFDYSRKGATITRAPETAEEKLAEIIIRSYNIDIQVDAKAFACFLTAFSEVEGFAAMPWGERQSLLSEIYNVSVDERTLRNWCNKLINTNTIKKSDEKIYWCTQVINGKKKRLMVDGDEDLEQEMREYWEIRKRLLEDFISTALASGRKDYKTINAEAWQNTNLALWKEFGCCYYSCKSLVFSAFDDLDVLEEIFDLVKEVMVSGNDENIHFEYRVYSK